MRLLVDLITGGLLLLFVATVAVLCVMLVKAARGKL